jgi:hypothetical protein
MLVLYKKKREIVKKIMHKYDLGVWDFWNLTRIFAQMLEARSNN